MEIIVKAKNDIQLKHDLAIYFLSEGNEKKQLIKLDAETAGIASVLVNQMLAQAKVNTVYTAPTYGKITSSQIGIIGLGDPKVFNLEQVRRTGGVIAQAARSAKAKTVTVNFDDLLINKKTTEEVARVLTEGMLLGSYEFKEFKTTGDDDAGTIENVVLLVGNEQIAAGAQNGILHGTIEAEAAIFTRNLVNRPPAALHPGTLKAAAESVAADSHGLITIKTYNRQDLKKMGAGAILGVAQGSEFEPYLIHLEYNAQDTETAKSVALVGKGVTFDSGGYSIKPAQSMEDMKMDMAGAAIVLGVFSALAKLKPKVHVHGIAPCVENMVSDRAMRVGDILKTLSGKTVEVQNTDAEGRLILADALTYAERLSPDYILDFATLTGACMVALGDQIAGLMCDDSKLSQLLMECSAESGEPICQLPLYQAYEEDMKSEVADLSNIHKSRYGGAIMGGLFLKQFVQKTPWAHFDIAGPAFAHKPFNSYTTIGGTGFGVRTVMHWLHTLAK